MELAKSPMGRQSSQKVGDATRMEMQEVGQAGSIAEESVLGVRTVQAFNAQEEMVGRSVSYS